MDRFIGQMQTEKQMFVDLVPVLPSLFSWDLYQSIWDTVETMGMLVGYAGKNLLAKMSVGQPMDPQTMQKILMDNFPQSQCVYWYAENGKFRPCNKDQLEAFKKQQCPLCRDITENLSPLAAVTKYQAEIAAKEAEIAAAATTFDYSMPLNTYGEGAIESADLALLEINKTIQDAYEGAGNTVRKALPTFCGKLLEVAKSQCVNKKALENFPACK